MNNTNDPKIVAALDNFRAHLETKRARAGLVKSSKSSLLVSRFAFRASVWLAAKRRKLERMKRRADDQKLEKLVRRHGIDYDVIQAIHAFTGENWKETSRKCGTVIEHTPAPSPAPGSDESFKETHPDNEWIDALTCRCPFSPDTVRMVFRVCEGDRDTTRRIIEAFAPSGSIPTEGQVLRLKS